MMYVQRPSAIGQTAVSHRSNGRQPLGQTAVVPLPLKPLFMITQPSLWHGDIRNGRMESAGWLLFDCLIYKKCENEKNTM